MQKDYEDKKGGHCFRAVAEGALDGAIGPEALFAIAGALGFELLQNRTNITGAALPFGRAANILRASGAGIVAGVAVGYVVGGVSTYLSDPICSDN